MLLVAVAAAVPSFQETDFSGYWVHDVDASRIETAEVLSGLGGGGAPENLFVSQARDGSLVVSSDNNPSQSRAYRIGGESTVPAPGEQGGGMSVSTRREGSALVNEGSVETPDGAFRVRERLSLQDDGNTLVLEATLVNAVGEMTNRLVYRRRQAP
jgi:hypothetical protein